MSSICPILHMPHNISFCTYSTHKIEDSSLYYLNIMPKKKKNGQAIPEHLKATLTTVCVKDARPSREQCNVAKLNSNWNPVWFHSSLPSHLFLFLLLSLLHLWLLFLLHHYTPDTNAGGRPFLLPGGITLEDPENKMQKVWHHDQDYSYLIEECAWRDLEWFETYLVK